jgi:hypothetical protein
VTITKIEVEGMTIRLETENAQRIVALQNTGKRFAIAEDRVIEVQVPEFAKYVRFECWGPGERMAWTQPFFVEENAAEKVADKDALPYITTWQVSPLQEHGTLEDASPEQAAKLSTQQVVCYPKGHAAAGFVDVQPQTQGQPGIVYLTAQVESDRDIRGILRLGYDGPIRAWVNGKEVFAGPGSNPAVPDKAVVYADFKQGSNILVIALDSNGGKAWGIYGRVEL